MSGDKKNEYTKNKEMYEFVKEEFKYSKFYEKYKDENKYYVEWVCKHLFKEDIGVTDCKIDGSRTCGSATYSQVVEQNCKVIGDLIELFVKPFCGEYVKVIKKMVEDKEGGIYLDPDKQFDYSKIKDEGFGDITFSYDGLISINSILEFNKGILFDKETFINEYKKCRDTPIFFFPSKKCGKQTINQGRNVHFEDRIDYTLFDIKNYLGGKECKMKDIYENGDTKRWLEIVMENGGFKYLVELYGINNIFVKEEGDDYKIIDIENNDGKTFINKYLDNKNDYEWKENYYNNLRSMIIDFKNKLNNSDK